MCDVESRDLLAQSQDVGRMFTERLQRYGDGHECAEHRDVASQELRLHELCKIGDLREARVLDFGCATAHLLTVLKRDYGFRGQYCGYDVSEAMIEVARAKHPDAEFHCRDILLEGMESRYDYVLISGTFNDHGEGGDRFMRAALPVLYSAAERGVAFNNLSRYVDYFDEGLFYADPGEVFRYCKEHLSPLVGLRHDYLTQSGVVPYEFTTHVYRTDVSCRALVAA